MPGYLNPANAVTASRFLTIPPFVYYLDAGNGQAAMIALLVCGLFDKLDGMVAKLFDCKSEFGAILDAVTDAICYGLFLILLAAYGWVPWLPVALIVGFGFYNVGVRSLYAKRIGKNINYRSFAMERVVAYAAFLIGFGLADYEVTYFYWGYVAINAIVLAHDTKRMLVDPVPA